MVPKKSHGRKRHGWQYFYEDFLRLHDGTVTELTTRRTLNIRF